MFTQITDASLEAVSALLAFFYSLPVVGGNYGLAIMMLTIAVMIVLMPLTLRATRSTIKMTMLQPQLKALQKKHKDDRQTLNQEMMALYQKNGVNPIGGCLPMLAQLPVFLLLFNVLRGLSRRAEDAPYFALSQRAQELAGATVNPADGQTFEPQYLDHDSELYLDLATETEIGFGPFDLSAQAWDVLQSNIISSIPYLLLIVFVVATSYYQQRQISARRGAVPDNPTPQQQTQQQLLRILPLMSGIWSFFFPAGLVLYWATSNLFRIGQQAYITRALYSEEGEGTAAMQAMADATEAADDEDDEDDEPATTDEGSGSGSGKNNGRSRAAGAGTASGRGSGRANGQKRPAHAENGSSTPADRDEAWARRRAERARSKPKKQSSSSGSGGGTGGRVTPKGTKPTDTRKKRKR